MSYICYFWRASLHINCSCVFIVLTVSGSIDFGQLYGSNLFSKLGGSMCLASQARLYDIELWLFCLFSCNEW